nr:hypothetical protein MarFTME_057 [Marseillevirus futianmevirus]
MGQYQSIQENVPLPLQKKTSPLLPKEKNPTSFSFINAQVNGVCRHAQEGSEILK